MLPTESESLRAGDSRAFFDRLAAGCQNFRDVGFWINSIADRQLFPEWRLFRGGRLDDVIAPEERSRSFSVFNLRASSDPLPWRARPGHFHISAENRLEKYDTRNREVRDWLNRVLEAIASAGCAPPILVHCASGRDRTGIVTAALLHAIGVPSEVIVEEYLLSDGSPGRTRIEQAIDGIGDAARYFHRVDLRSVRKKLLD